MVEVGDFLPRDVESRGNTRKRVASFDGIGTGTLESSSTTRSGVVTNRRGRSGGVSRSLGVGSRRGIGNGFVRGINNPLRFNKNSRDHAAESKQHKKQSE